MSTPLTPLNCKIYYRPESTFGDGGSGTWLPFDFTDQLREYYEIGDPEKLYSLYNAIGLGKTPSIIIEGGYKAGEQSTSFDLLTGILLKYALGTETTTEVTTGVYQHVITATDGQLPSFAMLIYQPFSTPYTYKLSGIKVKSFELSAEIGDDAPVRATVDLMIAKAETVTDSVPSTSLSLRRMNFPDVSTLQITYNSTNITDKPLVNKLSLKIENEIEYKNEFGQDYPTRVLEGKRTITLSSDQMIRTSNILTLSKTLYRNYATDIAFSFKTARNATSDYIQIDINKLILKPLKNKLPSWESKQLMQELQFENAPGCTITATVVDTVSTY